MKDIIINLARIGNKRPVTDKDLSQIEKKLGIVIPEDMKAFYLQINGTGILGIEMVCKFHSPITKKDYELSHFLPFKYGGQQFTIDGDALIARVEENRTPNLLMFAIAEDYSRFVIDVATGCIYNYQHKEVQWYFTKEGRQIFFDNSTRAEHSGRSSSEAFCSEVIYYLANKELVANSFTEFICNLTIDIVEEDAPNELPQSRHTDYLGKVTYAKYMGFKAERKVEVPALNMDACVYLGKAFNTYGDEVTTPPTVKKLDEYEQTLKQFLDNINSIVEQISEKAYKYYQKNYAHYYEKPFEVIFPNDMVMPQSDSKLHAPLGITNPTEHLTYMTYNPCERIQVLNRKTIIIPFDYALDEEHGMEVKIVDGKVKAVGEAGEI